LSFSSRTASGSLLVEDAQQLQQVVLDHVAQCASLVVEHAAAFDADLLRDRDLDVPDPSTTPQRFEQRVAEPQRDQVLHRLLP
jgi:hypothetical protein